MLSGERKMATKQDIEKLITAIKSMDDELDETLTDRFADLEMGLEETGLRENEYIFRIFDRASDYQFKIHNDLQELIKILKLIIRKG
jgi:hypothetical protein